MDAATRKLIADLGDALREARRQHEALTLMFDAVVRACDELEKQAERGTLRSVS